jgi:molybdopterin molybdotransferase
MLLEYDIALNIMQENAKTLGTEKVSLNNSLNRVLAENIYSDMNMPPFDKSAMDGYACRKQDLENELEVLEIIGAGYEPNFEVGENQCSKIMTGAKVPKGADTVIVIEAVQELNNGKIKYRLKESKSNICYIGEDVKPNDLLINKNIKIKSKHIPILASVGKTEIKVYKLPKIAIISTGDELVEPHQTPKSSQIRNTNAYQLVAQVKELGIDAKYIGIAKDNKESTSELLNQAIAYADLIIISGAVSVGDFDFVPQVLMEKNFDFLFHGVATKPGKRTLFGVNENQWVIGVPGNPVSSFIQFQMLIKPFINKLMGYHQKFDDLKLEMGEDFKRKNAKRLSFEPVAIINNKIERVKYNGSANITALVDADAVMLVPKGINEIKKGEYVYVRPI